MSHDPKFVDAIKRVYSQIERKDYPAALRTFAQTNYLPERAVMEFVRNAPPSLVVQFEHAFSMYCLDGLAKENIFDRSINITVLLTVARVRGLLNYLKMRDRFCSLVADFPRPLPLIITAKMSAFDDSIMMNSRHSVLTARGFVRVQFNAKFSQYSHPELSSLLTVCTSRDQAKKLERERKEAEVVKSKFVRPKTHEGWLELGFKVKTLGHNYVVYTGCNESGREVYYTAWYSIEKMDALHLESVCTGLAQVDL